MGRWSQRRHCGGGPQLPTIVSLITITRAQLTTLTNIEVTFSGLVTAASFNTLDFTAQPNAENPDTVTQVTGTKLALGFSNDQDTETSLDYTGTVSGVLTPQSVPIT